MLFNKPVIYSLNEELREFNLLQEEAAAPSTNPPQVKEPDDKGGDTAGPPQGSDKPSEKGYAVNVGDKAAGDRYNVPVRPDGKFTEPAKAEDEETSGTPLAENKKLPAFLQKKAAMKKAAMESEAVAEAEAAAAEVLEQAQQVIESYYNESENLSEAELRIVIEAFAVVTDAYDTMLEETTTQLESIVLAANQMEGEEAGEGEPDEDDDDKDDDKDEKAPKACAPAMESVTPTIARARRVLHESGGNDLNSIVSDLRSLEESLQIESPRAAALTKHAKVVEGFEALGNVCDQIVGRIDQILRTEAGVAEGEDYEISEEDARVEIAAFIAGIAESCQEQLSLLAGGKIDDATATENLARCQDDLEQAKRQMKAVAV